MSDKLIKAILKKNPVAELVDTHAMPRGKYWSEKMDKLGGWTRTKWGERVRIEDLKNEDKQK